MEKLIINRDNYITIQGWMVTELGLKGNELLIYAIIYGFSQAENHVFHGSLQYLSLWTNSSKQGVLKSLKSLEQRGLIIKKDKFINNVKFCEYHTTKFNEVLNKVEQGDKQSLTGGIKQSLPNNINNNKINDNIDNNKNTLDVLDDFFEKIWELYPKKTNKAQIKKATKERLYKIGYDKIARCIERYKMDLERNGTDYQYIKAGSTFFNGGYEDYLSDDWELPKERAKQAIRQSTTNNPFLEIAQENGIYVEGYYDKGRNNGNPFNS